MRSLRPTNLVLLACTTALLASPLRAQVRPDTARVADLVVTATRLPTSTSAVAAATTVISGDDLRARGVTFVLDALREVPGMMIVQSGSYGVVTSLFLRGGESDYVKVLLDGIPLNVPGGSIDFANLTTADLDRIEVVRGPASVLYGADAMSGVVQLFTRSGTHRASGALTVRGGTLNARDYDAHLSGGAGRLTGSFNGSRFASDGIYPFNSGYSNDVGSARLGWDGGEKGSAALTARLGDATAHFPTDYTGAPVDHNQLVTERVLALGLIASRPLTRLWTGTIQGFGSRNNRGATNRPDTPSDTVGFGYDADADAVTWRRGVEARTDWRPSTKAVVSVGVGMERETIDQKTRTAENFGGGAFEARDSFAVHRTTSDVYGQLLLTPGHTISMQLGGRLDHNSAFGSFATGRAGVSWQASSHTRIWTAAGTAFKAPTFFELFASSAFEVGNPSLAPEQSANAELGLERHVAGGRIILGATAFAQRFRNLIQYVSAAPGQPTYVNLGAARSRGLETSVGMNVSRLFSVKAHWTWLGTAVTDSGSASTVTFMEGKPLLRRPATSGGATVVLRPGSASISTTINYVGKRDDVDFRDFPSTRTALPSYTIVDAAAEIPVARAGGNHPGVDVTLRGENLFDASYIQTIGFAGRGRTLLGGVRVRF